jgi:hypothetical protein
LNALVVSSNQTDVLTLKEKSANHKLKLVEQNERLDNLTMVVKSLVEKVDTQDHAIETNRSGLISNSEAINAMRIDMENEQEITDERLDRTEATHELQRDHNVFVAKGFSMMHSLCQEIAAKTSVVNMEIENSQFDAEEMYKELAPQQQEYFRRRQRRRLRGKGGKRKDSPAVPVPNAYKKTKLTEDAKMTPVLAEAAAATTRTGTHAHAKAIANTSLKKAEAALVAHVQQEESRRENDREHREFVDPKAVSTDHRVVSPHS